MTLTVGSLFSGIGGIDLGLERAGMKVLWQVEIDEWCRAVLAKHWPDVERFEDVRGVGAGNLPRVDLICGGFPCQDISYAGRGVGIGGTRSGLWSEYARVIRELRPCYVLVENVPALLRRGLDVVLGDLAGSGYDAEWDCVPAAAIGAPHIRDRVFLLAYPRSEGRRQDAGGAPGDEAAATRRAAVEHHVTDGHGEGRRTWDVPNPEGDGWRSWRAGRLAREGKGPQILTAASADADSLTADGAAIAWRERSPWRTEPNVGRVAHGVPARVDRLRGLGNAVVPQVVEWIGRRIVEAEGQIEQ